MEPASGAEFAWLASGSTHSMVSVHVSGNTAGWRDRSRIVDAARPAKNTTLGRSPMTALSIKNVTKNYGDLNVVHEVSLGMEGNLDNILCAV